MSVLLITFTLSNKLLSFNKFSTSFCNISFAKGDNVIVIFSKHSIGNFAYKYSLCTFFTFESLKVDFMGRILHAYILGIVLSVILILLIKRETKIKDLC